MRIEDIDFNRCRPEYAVDLIEDLQWLGLHWQGDIRYQSENLSDYAMALERLKQQGLAYPCFCTRRDIQREIDNAGLAPHAEDMPEIYPGTCRSLSESKREQRLKAGMPCAWRLDVKASLAHVGDIGWRDTDGGYHPVSPLMNDAVIGRKDIGFSYHLAVVLDDAAQGITHVIRGEDLLPSTGLHRLLQAVLGLASPICLHHRLLCNADGERLAKRNGAPSLLELRTSGAGADTLRRFLCGNGGRVPPVWTGKIDS